MQNRILVLIAAAALFSSCAQSDLEAADIIACGDFDSAKQICDERDSTLYRFVKIGSQTWLAENLKYKTELTTYCYENNESNCDAYGRLYSWDIAMNGEPCPAGWRIPHIEEWETLAGNTQNNDNRLKAGSGWESGPDGQISNGDDNYGFSALPAGIRYAEIIGAGEECKEEFTEWGGKGKLTEFMSSSIGEFWTITADESIIICPAENSFVSIRCIKN